MHCGGKQTLKASGSTAQANAMTRFVNAFEQACSGQTLNYTANGSGAGINEFTGNQTDFGGSDSALSDDEHGKAQQRCGSPAWDLPVVFGPIAVTYNVNGVNSLNLDGPTAGQDLQRHDQDLERPGDHGAQHGHAAARSADPRGVPQRRVRERRTTSSSTSTRASDGAWGKGSGKSFNGGVGEGAKGNDGTSAAIKNTPKGRSPTTNGRSRRRRS